jgi:23S rRNA (pseudouridine1915-N3)-methyltransferase
VRIWIAAIGARPREGFNDLAKLYLDRIAGYLKSAIEAPLFRSEDALWNAVERERTRTAPMLVLLDERGKQMGSEDFAKWLGRERDDGRQLVIFAIGPANGWSDESRKRASLLLNDPGARTGPRRHRRTGLPRPHHPRRPPVSSSMKPGQ